MNISSVSGGVTTGDARQVQSNNGLDLASVGVAPAPQDSGGITASFLFSSMLNQLLPGSNSEASADAAGGDSPTLPSALTAQTTVAPASDTKPKMRLSAFTPVLDGDLRLRVAEYNAQVTTAIAQPSTNPLMPPAVSIPTLPSEPQAKDGAGEQDGQTPEPVTVGPQPLKPELEVMPSSLSAIRSNLIERPAVPPAIVAPDMATPALKPMEETPRAASEPNPNHTENTSARSSAQDSHGGAEEPLVQAAEASEPEIVPASRPQTVNQAEVAASRHTPEVAIAASENLSDVENTPARSSAGQSSEGVRTGRRPAINETSQSNVRATTHPEVQERASAESGLMRDAVITRPNESHASMLRQSRPEKAGNSNTELAAETGSTGPNAIPESTQPPAPVIPVQAVVPKSPVSQDVTTPIDDRAPLKSRSDAQTPVTIPPRAESVAPVTTEKRQNNSETGSQDNRQPVPLMWAPAAAVTAEPSLAPEQTGHTPANQDREPIERNSAPEFVRSGTPVAPTDTQVAFTGRLVERTTPETQTPAAAPPEPVRRPALERFSAPLTQEIASDRQPREFVEIERPTVHVEPNVIGSAIHREVASTTSRPVGDAAPTSRTTNSETIQQPVTRQAPGPVREISVRIGDPAQESAHLRVVERGGEVMVSVRSGSEQLARTLSSDLGELTHRLEQTGFQTELWRPVTQSSSSDLSGDRRDNASTAGQNQDQQSLPGERRNGQDQPGRNTRQLWDELDESLSFS